MEPAGGYAVAVFAAHGIGARRVNESQILAAIRKDLGREPDLVLWRLSQGGGRLVPVAALKRLIVLLEHGHVDRALTTINQLMSGSYAGYGLVNGASDLIGMLTRTLRYGSDPDECVGRFFAIEVKTPEHLTTIRNAVAKGNLTKLKQSDRDQIMFQGVVRARGGFACFADSQEAGRAALERARAGGSE